MGSGRSREVIGTFVGTGADLDIEKVGFSPNRIEVHNVDGLCMAVWTNVMADDSMLKTITAGTMSKVTTDGITPLSGGFTLGADTDLNVSGEEGFYIASD